MNPVFFFFFEKQKQNSNAVIAISRSNIYQIKDLNCLQISLIGWKQWGNLKKRGSPFDGWVKTKGDREGKLHEADGSLDIPLTSLPSSTA